MPRNEWKNSASGGFDGTSGEDVGQVEGRGLVELVETTGFGRAVGPPADELRGVAEAEALHVVVADLDDPLRAQGHERKVLATVPAAAVVPMGPLGHLVGRPVPRMVGEVD